MTKRLMNIRSLCLAGFLIFCILSISCPVEALAAKTIDAVTEEQILQTIRKHPEVVMEAMQLYRQQQQERKERLLDEFSREQVSFVRT